MNFLTSQDLERKYNRQEKRPSFRLTHFSKGRPSKGLRTLRFL